MLTYQDFEQMKQKDNIANIIMNYKTSSAYNKMQEAKEYYEGKNSKILSRLQWFFNSKGQKERDKFKANNQVPCDFYKKITKQEVQYLLGNGVTMDIDVKKEIGKNFDLLLQKAGLNSRLHGVSWTYCYIDKRGKFQTQLFKATEFVPLFDERTGQLKAGIRFYQISLDKPMYIELYELDGVTTYKASPQGGVELYEDKKAYKIKVRSNVLGSEEIAENWSVLPIIPLWGDETHESTLTPALKNKIDLYDIILSDFGNNLEDNNDIYWVLKNYQGQDMSEFLADYKYFKTIKTDDDGGAEAKTMETPHEARQVALNILRQQIYEDAMALDMKTLTGGSLTNVAINSAKTDLDLKTDEFEWQCVEYVESILELYNEYKTINLEDDIKFIRRTITNDTEVIDNIYKMRSDIDQETALRLNPYIDDKEIPNIIKSLDKETEIAYNNIVSNIKTDESTK